MNRCWEGLLSYGTRATYGKGSIIPHRESNSFYYLEDGIVGIFYTSSCGKERLTLLIHSGCIFNEARVASGLEADGYFICMKKSIVWRFPKKLLEDPLFICNHPQAIANLIASMGTKILTHYIFLAEMGTGSHEKHLCRFIMALWRENSCDTSFPCHMTQQQVASLLGIHRTTLARMVRSLKERGVISAFTASRICIEDPEALAEIALR